MLYVIGFVVVELSGILNVCLFNKLQKTAQQSSQVSQDDAFSRLEPIKLNFLGEVEKIESNFPLLSYRISIQFYSQAE